MRKIIAERTDEQSSSLLPQLTLHRKADLTEL